MARLTIATAPHAPAALSKASTAVRLERLLIRDRSSIAVLGIAKRQIRREHRVGS